MSKPVMKKYEIWIGWYSLGQGYSLPVKPVKKAEIEATSFKIACVLYEHQKTIDSLKKQMKEGDTFIEDMHFGGWDYDVETNSNSWTGRYFESEEAALPSFNPVDQRREDTKRMERSRLKRTPL